MPSKSRAGNSADSKLTVSYSSIEKNSAGTQGRITSSKMEFYSKSGWSDSTNRWRVRGGAITDKSWGARTVNGGTESFACTGQWVNLEFDEQVTAAFIGECAGVSFYENDNNSSYYGPSLTVTYPFRTYAAPAAPGVTLTRTNDSAATIAVTGNQTNAKADQFWQFIDWQLQTDAGSFAGGGSGLAGSTTSIPVSGLQANRRYRVQVRARNRDATGSWVQSGYIYTAPAAPASASVAASGTSDVVSAAVTGAPWRSGIQVERSENGGAWGNLVTVPGADAWIRTGAPQGSSRRYRVRTYVTFGAVTLASGWVETGLLLAVPDAPTIGRCYRISDTQQVVAWTRAATADNPNKPATSHEVQVQTDETTAAEQTIATPTGSAAQVTHSGTAANHRYRYRVRARNSGGNSAWSAWSEWIATTPAAPVVTATTKQGTAITTAWTNNAPHQSGVDVFYKAGAAAFVAEASLGAATTSYLDADPNPAEVAQYALQARIDNVPLVVGTTSLWSAQVTGPTGQLQAPPQAPTVTLTPAAVADLALSALRVDVTHRPVDSTPQSACEVRYREVGDPSWVTASLGTAAYVGLSLYNGATWEVQARTKGDHVDWSPWSPSVTIKASATPSATITAPADGSTVTTARLLVGLAYSDPEGSACSGWQIRLADATLADEWTSGVLSGDLHAAPYEIPYTVADGSVHTLYARARDGDGLWSPWTSALVEVDYAPPPAAEPVAVWDADTGTTALNLTIPEPDGSEVEAITVAVYRIDGTSRVLVAEQPAAAALLILDRIPPTNADVAYEIHTVSAIPSVAVAHATVATPSDWVYVNGGPDWATLARLRASTRGRGVSISKQVGRVRTQRQFVGDDSPTSFRGRPVGRRWQISADTAIKPHLAAVVGHPAEWEAIAMLDDDPLCLRTYTGVRAFVSLVSDPKIDDGDTVAVSVAVTLVEVRHDE